MDEYNRPLYGDVFGVLQGAEIAVSLIYINHDIRYLGHELTFPQGQDQIDRSLWGEIAPMEYDDDEEEEEDDEEEEMEAEEEDDRRRPPADGLETPSGMATPSGLNSVTSTVPGGLETPEFVDLRKKKRQESEAPGPGPSQPRDLYQVIPERESTSRGFMGSSTAYDISGLGQSGPGVLGADDLSKKVSLTPFPSPSFLLNLVLTSVA